MCHYVVFLFLSDAFIKSGWSHNGVMFGSQFYTKLCLHEILT